MAMREWVAVAVVRKPSGKHFYREVLDCGHYFDPEQRLQIGTQQRRWCAKCQSGKPREISEGAVQSARKAGKP